MIARKFAVTTALMLAPLLVYAGRLATPAHAATKAEPGVVCKVYSDAANLIMGARQNDLSKARVIEVMTRDEELTAGARKKVVDIVEQAYAQPRLGTREQQHDAIGAFRSRTFLSCYAAMTATG